MIYTPRPPQITAIDLLWEWFRRHDAGNPVMDCCVGSGKSLMMSMAIKRALFEYPETRITMVCHQKELLQQNLNKMLNYYPDADVGIYSAALGRKDVGHRITYATIGSIYRDAHLMGAVQLVFCDEAHLVNTQETGMWRKFIADMKRYGNPGIRVVGWTGTPFRNGGIWITAGDDALFTGIAARITMTDMLAAGYLCPLVPVVTTARIDTSDARTIAGDWATADLAIAADREDIVAQACAEIVVLAKGRKRLLVFAVNVAHAHHVGSALESLGVTVGVVTGETPAAERARMLANYAADRIRCMVSIGVLTTGFDQPDIDFIALLRPTKSPTLAIQMCGRGMRTAPGKVDCAFADFTTTIETLGPIDRIKGRNPSPKGTGEAPFRLCPECGSRNAAAATACIDCEFAFPLPERVTHSAIAHYAPVLSIQADLIPPNVYAVTEVRYARHQKEGKPDSLRVEYYSGLRRVVSEWVLIEHGGYASSKAQSWWLKRSGGQSVPASVGEALGLTGDLRVPMSIVVNDTGRFPELVSVVWTSEVAA